MRKPPKYLSLKRPRLRQSWNIHNLYNLVRLADAEESITRQKTFFQQKWSAKSRTRAYHGEHVPEKKFKRVFSRRLRMAVDMPAKYLAINDGSEQATGRGSGLATDGETAANYWKKPENASLVTKQPHTAMRNYPMAPHKTVEGPLANVVPLMQMTFAPLERRLDTAIFRALFASSVRQARQYIVHGSVKVNGKKMVYPSYQLNAGDMFQVDIPKVLQGTGAQPNKQERREVLQMTLSNEKKFQKLERQLLKEIQDAAKTKTKTGEDTAAEDPATEGTAQTSTKAAAAKEVADADAEAPAEESTEEATEKSTEEGEAEAAAEESTLTADQELQLKKLRLEWALLPAKQIIREGSQNTENMSFIDRLPTRIRDFKDRIGYVLSNKTTRDVEVDELMNEVQLEMKMLDMLREDRKKDEAKPTDDAKKEAKEASKARLEDRNARINKVARWTVQAEKQQQVLSNIGFDDLSTKEMHHFKNIIKNDSKNPVDEFKTYQTPWQPKPFMAPWAFVPRYLEVNHNACAAVYLRHPVARRGAGEVPTPFNYFTNQLAHNWYVQRGSKNST